MTHSEEIAQTRLDSVLISAEEPELYLFEEGGLLIGVMRPMTARYLDRMDVMEKLTDWRNVSMKFFLTHIEGTIPLTIEWVKNVLLKSRSQMLWLIYDQNDNLVGHLGFKNLTSQSVQLDNAMRGERQIHPELLVIAGKSLVQWLWQTTPVMHIEAHVLANNAPSIMMIRKIGFQSGKRFPLIKRIVNGSIDWSVGKESQPSPDDCYSLHFFIERSANLLPLPAGSILPRCQIY
jgi:hypothetical protein